MANRADDPNESSSGGVLFGKNGSPHTVRDSDWEDVFIMGETVQAPMLVGSPKI